MKVLVAVDLQNDFINGALGTAEAAAMLPVLEALTADQLHYGSPPKPRIRCRKGTFSQRERAFL